MKVSMSYEFFQGDFPRVLVTILLDKWICFNRSSFQMPEFNSVLNRLADMTTANVDSMEVHHNTWTSQIKDVMRLLLNGQ